jgi:hypothetical protein
MGIRAALLRWLVCILIGLATFWPDYGVAWLSWRWFSANPAAVALFDLFWLGALATALPLTLRVYRLVTVLAVVGIQAIALFLAYTSFPDRISGVAPVIWAVVIVFSGFGWWRISTPLWRWASGIVAVQTTGLDIDSHDQ